MLVSARAASEQVRAVAWEAASARAALEPVWALGMAKGEDLSLLWQLSAGLPLDIN